MHIPHSSPHINTNLINSNNKKHWIYEFLPLSVLYLCIVSISIMMHVSQYFAFENLNDVISDTHQIIPTLNITSNIILVIGLLIYWFKTNKWSQKKLFCFLVIPFIAYASLYSIFFNANPNNMFTLLSKSTIENLVSQYPDAQNIILSYTYLFYSLYHVVIDVLPTFLTFFFWSLCVQILNKKQAFLYFILFLLVGHIPTLPTVIFFLQSHKIICSILFALFAVSVIYIYFYMHKKASKLNKNFAETNTKANYLNFIQSLKNILKNKYFWIIVSIPLLIKFEKLLYKILWLENVHLNYPIRENLHEFYKNFVSLQGGATLGLVIILSIFSIFKKANWYKITIGFSMFLVLFSVALFFKPFQNMLFSNGMQIYIAILNTTVFLLFPFFVLVSSSRLMQTKGLALIFILILPNLHFISTLLCTFLIMFTTYTGNIAHYISTITLMILINLGVIFLVKGVKPMLQPWKKV